VTSHQGAVPELGDPQLALERMAEAYYAIGPDWCFRYANASAEAFWGRPRAQLLGRSMFELFPQFEGSPSHTAHRQAMESGQPAIVEVVSTATGAPVELRLYPSAEGLSVYFLDISQRRRLEAELRTREEMLSLAELSAGIGIWVQDLPSSTMTATPQFFRLLGIDPIDGPVPQDYVRSFRHPEDRDRHTQNFRDAIAAGANTFEGEYRIITPSGDERWIFGRGRVTRDGRGLPWRYSGVDIDITERKAQEAHLRVVMGELLHRSNNLLMVVQGLAQQTARSSASLTDFVPVFSARLQGLAQSSTLLAREDWRGVALDELVAAQVAPFAAAERFELSGPKVILTPKAVQNLGLALHELGTNAVKYGALSVPAGRVRVNWAIEGDSLRVVWKEQGGPPVPPPRRQGFGRVVAEQLLSTALGATVDTNFATDGLEWTLVMAAEHYRLEAPSQPSSGTAG
jgi:PAS domain S-box-containing protein